MEKYIYVDERGLIEEGFSDFKGKRVLTNKKINKKYHLYYDHGERVVVDCEHGPMEIIEIVHHKGKQIIFYSDLKSQLSFIIAKYHPTLEPFEIIDKLEKTPMTRSVTFMLMKYVLFFGVMRFKDNSSFLKTEISFGFKKSYNYKVNFLFPKSIRNKYSMKSGKLHFLLHFFWFRIPLKDVYNYHVDSGDINIPVFVKVYNNGRDYFYNFKSNLKDDSKKYYLFSTRSTRIKNTVTEMYLRKSITGQYVIVVTSVLSKWIGVKEYVAYLLSRFKINKNKYDLYFEKFCQDASQSAFELFKYDVQTNKYAVYILDNEHPKYSTLKKEYPKNLYAKNSIKALYRLFLARRLLSTEMFPHAQRRLYDNSRLIKKKLMDNKNKVFLQHGVSLATNLFVRGYYNKKLPISPDYIIVNSKFEKDLFLEKSAYKDDELIVTGLPNIDLYVKSKNEKKDEITFLLTWRPWDLRGSIEKGSYISRYLQFIEKVKTNKFYHGKKINIVLHPKAKLTLQEQFSDFYEENEKYFYDGEIKDALLKSKVLISDYSSVTYMAFCGGTNIAFYWEDKEKCEKKYGSPNILQENIAFGDIAYDFNDLDRIIRKNYQSDQRKDHIKQFNSLVECTDGNNTSNTHRHLSKIIV